MLGIAPEIIPGGVKRGEPYGHWFFTRPKSYQPPGYGVQRSKSRFPMPPVNPGPNVMGITDWGWQKMAIVGIGAYVLYKVL